MIPAEIKAQELIEKYKQWCENGVAKHQAILEVKAIISIIEDCMIVKSNCTEESQIDPLGFYNKVKSAIEKTK